MTVRDIILCLFLSGLILHDFFGMSCRENVIDMQDRQLGRRLAHGIHCNLLGRLMLAMDEGTGGSSAAALKRTPQSPG